MLNFQINPIHDPEARGHFDVRGNVSPATSQPFVSLTQSGYGASVITTYAVLSPADARTYAEAILDAAAAAEAKAPVKLTIEVKREHAAALRTAIARYGGRVFD